MSNFNPRTRMGCDLSTSHGSLLYCANFNPRTRMGCDFVLDRGFYYDTEISIHAPAWGATRMANFAFRSYPISIHAPAWGATPIIT